MTVKTTVQSQWRGRDVKIQGKKVVGKTIYEVGLVIEGQAKLFCAVNWGYLAASITTQAGDGRGTEPGNPTEYQKGATPYGVEPELSSWDMTIQAPDEEFEVFVGTPVFYGPYVEYLHRPFLRPAFDMAMGKVLTIAEKNGRLEFVDYLIPRGQNAS